MSSRPPAYVAEAVDHPTHLMAWTAERLDTWVRTSGVRERLIVVANGINAAVEPLLRACSGVCIVDDRQVDATSHQLYSVRGIAIENDEAWRQFDGFANDGLWPLCHRAHVKPTFRPDDFTTYWAVNAQFADAACDEAADSSPLIFVQDHHCALAPQLIRERLPLARISTFWHIPWPHWQDFEICPWSRYLLEGLLGSSIIGFQTPLDCRNFIETVERCLGAHVDRYQDALTYNGRQVLVRAYPWSVRWPDRWGSCSPPSAVCRESIRRQLQLSSDVQLGVGVDGMDPSAGVEEKLLAIERLLDCYAEMRGHFVFAQLLAPYRHDEIASRDLRARILAIRDRVNERFGTPGAPPIVVLEDRHAPAHVNLFLRAADFCYVGSLHDGMNLLSKEFVSSRDDECGVLVLSTFTGAARELTDALIVNPYDIDEGASVLARALTMSADEQADRMRRLRSVVADFSAYRWAAQVLNDATRLRHER